MSANAWSALEVRHLVTLLAVAEESSFSRAAERLGYTQSAVSQQVGALERIVGATLFERPGGPRRIRLTEAGAVLRGHAEAVLARLGAAEADVRALVAGEGGTLRIGTIQSIGTRVLPEVLRRFGRRWPEVRVSLREAADDELLALVEAGELDLAFVALPVGPGPFSVFPMLEDPYVFVCAAATPEAARPSIPVEAIARLPLVGNVDAGCQDGTLGHFRDVDEAPTFVFLSDNNTTVQRCIAAGLGAGLLPWLTVDEADDEVAVVPLDPPVPPRRLALVRHQARTPSRVATAFLDLATAVCDELAAGRPAPGAPTRRRPAA